MALERYENFWENGLRKWLKKQLNKYMRIKNQMSRLRMKSNEDSMMITKLLAILLSPNQSMITEI